VLKRAHVCVVAAGDQAQSVRQTTVKRTFFLAASSLSCLSSRSLGGALVLVLVLPVLEAEAMLEIEVPS
jgi:hypothetical protein